MRKYRLKKEACPFFQEKHATALYSFDTWDSIGVDMKALEEVEPVYITYGHQDKNNRSASLAGWGKEGGHFHFTLNFPNMEWREHDDFTQGRVLRKLMDEIQVNVDRFRESFLNKEKGQLIRPEADNEPIETVKIGVQVETPDGLGTVESVEINEYNQTVYLVAHPKREPFPGIGGSITRSFWTRAQRRVLSVKEKF